MTTLGSQSFDEWARGYGVIAHAPQTRERIRELAQRLTGADAQSENEIYDVLSAADRLASAAMWVVAHMTYAKRVDLTGAALPATSFKASP